MRIIRYKNQQDKTQYGWVLEDSDGLRVGSIEGSLFSEFRRLEANTPFDEVPILAPAQPSKIIGIGRNYAAHAREHKVEVPEVPLTFLKPPSSLIGPLETIILPPQSNQVEHEAELAVIIGKSGRWISPGDAAEFILGYSIANDVTARDLQRSDSLWTRGKGFDTFCSLGPWIETDFDPADAVITCYVNEEMRQMGSTRDMVYSVNQLIAFISSVMTLEPGDVILTGTPSGVSPLYDGDKVEITIEGLGTLSNPVSSDESG